MAGSKMPTLKTQLDRRQQDQGDRQHRRAEEHHNAGGVHRPDEKRHPEPRHAGGPHVVDRDQEVEGRQDRREADDENAEAGEDHVGVRRGGAVRRVEGPAGVDAADQQHGKREDGGDDVDVPAQEVEPGKGEVAGPDAERQGEVAEDRGDRRDQEEEHHDDPVHGERFVVVVAREEIAGRGQQLEAHERRRHAAEHEHQRHGDEVEDADPLVVQRQQPRLDAVGDVEIRDRRRLRRRGPAAWRPRTIDGWR